MGNLKWQIRTPDTIYFTRTASQKFVQDPEYPGILYNHVNEFLHYQDDWYILSSKIENKPYNYGGAVVYTRSAALPKSIVPELERAARSVGRDLSKFIRTDNTCRPKPPIVERLEKMVEAGERTIVKEVEKIEEKAEKVKDTEIILFKRLAEGFEVLKEDEEYFLRELSKVEKDVLDTLKMETNEVEKLFGHSLPFRKLR